MPIVRWYLQWRKWLLCAVQSICATTPRQVHVPDHRMGLVIVAVLSLGDNASEPYNLKHHEQGQAWNLHIALVWWRREKGSEITSLTSKL